MSSCHIVVDLDEIGLGKDFDEIAAVLQGSRVESEGLRSLVYSRPYTNSVELIELTFFNAELHHRFGKLTTEKQTILAERLAFVGQHKVQTAIRREIEPTIEVELQWAATKRRRVGLMWRHIPAQCGSPPQSYHQTFLELRLI